MMDRLMQLNQERMIFKNRLTIFIVLEAISIFMIFFVLTIFLIFVTNVGNVDTSTTQGAIAIIWIVIFYMSIFVFAIASEVFTPFIIINAIKLGNRNKTIKSLNNVE